jgi:hypothetical protein
MGPLIGSLSTASIACDVCAVYLSTEMSESRTGFSLGIAEQFTQFGTVPLDGEEIANPADEHLESSITQLLFSYTRSRDCTSSPTCRSSLVTTAASRTTASSAATSRGSATWL